VVEAYMVFASIGLKCKAVHVSFQFLAEIFLTILILALKKLVQLDPRWLSKTSQ
jgi:hypothetical protein